MKRSCFLYMVSMLFCGSNIVHGMSLYHQVAIERDIYDEIAQLHSLEIVKREKDAKSAFRECGRLSNVLINEVDQFVGLVRESGPSYEGMKLGERSRVILAFPLIPSIFLATKCILQFNDSVADLGLALGSIFFGSLIQWGYLEQKRKEPEEIITQTAGSIYDIAHAHRYYPLDLLSVLKTVPSNYMRERIINRRNRAIWPLHETKKSG